MSRPPVQRTVLRTTRRTTLGGALVGVTLLAGCDLGPDDPSRSPTSSSGADDPDAQLVAGVIADVVATASLVEAVRRRHASLRRPLGGLVRTHEAHLEALGSSEHPGRRPAPRGKADALALVGARELRHQRVLADRAVAADSGELARLLASMSAAVAQQLTGIPAGEGR